MRSDPRAVTPTQATSVAPEERAARTSSAKQRPAAKSGVKSGASGASEAPAANALDTRSLLRALQAMRDGDFTVRLPGDLTGLDGKVADTFNEIVAANQHMAHELERVGQVVGKQGGASERARFDRSQGAWGSMETSINTLIGDLLRPTSVLTEAIAAVAQGDLRQTVRLDVEGRPLEGEFLRSAVIVNTMIQQLGVFRRRWSLRRCCVPGRSGCWPSHSRCRSGPSRRR